MSKFSKCQNFQICTVNCQRFAMTRIILQNTWPQLDFHHLSLHPFNRFTPSQENHPSTIKQRISFFSFFLQKIKRDDQVPHDDTDSGEAGEEVSSCSYFQICCSFFLKFAVPVSNQLFSFSNLLFLFSDLLFLFSNWLFLFSNSFFLFSNFLFLFSSLLFLFSMS